MAIARECEFFVTAPRHAFGIARWLSSRKCVANFRGGAQGPAARARDAGGGGGLAAVRAAGRVQTPIGRNPSASPGRRQRGNP